MKKLLLISTLILSSCGALNCFDGPEIPEKPNTSSVAETPRERLTNDLEAYLIWATIAATLGAILSLALSFKIPGLSHVAYICGLVAGGCAMAVYALEWIWLIIGVCFWGLIAWGAYHIYKRGKEINEKDGIVEELAANFEDPDGEHKLSHKARNIQLIHRRKGVKKGE